MRLTEHFTKEEMEVSNTAVRFGMVNTCPPALIPNMLRVAVVLESVRSHFDLPITVLSGFRSGVVNAAVGGSGNSAHRYALAADIQIKGKSVKEVAEWCRDNIENYDQVIYEFGQWVHIGLPFAGKEGRMQALTAVKENNRTVYKQGIVDVA